MVCKLQSIRIQLFANMHRNFHQSQIKFENTHLLEILNPNRNRGAIFKDKLTVRKKIIYYKIEKKPTHTKHN